MTEPAWYAVVLSWNGRDDTLRCLDSLARVSEPPIRIVCVDNGSTDGSVEAIRERHPGVRLIENGANLGFSGGNNVGLRWAMEEGAEWIVLVNNDAVVAEDALAGFAAVAAGHPGAGVLAGKLYLAEAPDRIWFAGQRYLAWLGYSGRARGLGRRDSARYRRVIATDRAAGALMAVSRRAIERVGLLDDELFAYAEDVDWSLRIREAGFEVLFAPEARAWHAEAGFHRRRGLDAQPLLRHAQQHRGLRAASPPARSARLRSDEGSSSRASPRMRSCVPTGAPRWRRCGRATATPAPGGSASDPRAPGRRSRRCRPPSAPS